MHFPYVVEENRLKTSEALRISLVDGLPTWKSGSLSYLYFTLVWLWFAGAIMDKKTLES